MEIVLIVGGKIPWFGVLVGRRIFPGFVLIVPLLKEGVLYRYRYQKLKKLLFLSSSFVLRRCSFFSSP